MRHLGKLAEWGDYPRRHAEAEFHRVLRFEDEIEVRLLAERVGRASITYA
jgi:acyl-CoA thioesterase FadM